MKNLRKPFNDSVYDYIVEPVKESYLNNAHAFIRTIVSGSIFWPIKRSTLDSIAANVVGAIKNLK